MEPFEKQYSRKEVAAILGVSYDTAGRLIEAGELEATEYPKCGGRGLNKTYRVSESAIQRFLSRNRRGRR